MTDQNRIEEIRNVYCKGTPSYGWMVDIGFLLSVVDELTKRIELYERVLNSHTAACEPLRTDKSIGLTLGMDIITDGVPKLIAQRDQAHAELAEVQGMKESFGKLLASVKDIPDDAPGWDKLEAMQSAMEDEVDELRLALAQARAEVKTSLAINDRLTDGNVALMKINSKARADLRKHGKHDPGCSSNYHLGLNKMGACTCGYAEALQRAEDK